MPSQIRPRYQSLQESGMEPLTENHISRLQYKLKSYLYNAFGVRLEENNRAPNSNGYIPRILVMGRNSEGRDFPQSVNDTPYTPGSREFLEQVQLGNVFVYPAGKANPVQLQIETAEKDASFRESVEVTPELMPEPYNSPRPLTGWRWLLNLVFRRPFRGRKRAWERAQEDRASVKEKLAENAQVRAATAEQEAQAFARELEKAKLDEQVETAGKAAQAAATGKKNFVDTFQPTPLKREDMLKNNEGHPLGGNYALYHESDFRDLTILTADEEGVRQALQEQDRRIEENTIRKIREKGLPEEKTRNMHPDQQANGKRYQFRKFDQNAIQIGGKPLSNAQFAAVGLAACFQIKRVKAGHQLEAVQYDQYLEQSLIQAGYPAKDAENIANLSFRNMGTTDLFILPPRDNEGFLFKDYINPARLEAADAFDAYRRGDKLPLAKLIAGGVNTIPLDFCDQVSGSLTVQGRGAVMMGEELLGLVKQDPKLGELAAQNGMEQDKLESLQGMIKVQKLEQQARQAEYEILKARQDQRPLSKEEKQRYGRQIIGFKLCMQQLNAHSKQVAAGLDSAFTRFTNSAQLQNPPKKPNSGISLPRPERPAPPQGFIYSDSLAAAATGVKMLYTPQPKFLRQLSASAGEEKLRDFCDEIVRQEHLAEMDDGQFFKRVKLEKGELKLSDHLVALNEAIAPNQAQNVAQGAVKNEMKQQEGPQPGLQQHS